MPIAGAGKLIEAMRNLKHSSQDAKKAEQRLRNMWEEATSDNVQLWLALRELGFKRTKKSEFEDAKNKFVSEKTNRIISECWLVHKRNGQTCKQRSVRSSSCAPRVRRTCQRGWIRRKCGSWTSAFLSKSLAL
eukprot:4395768-Pyramimonas_sp.AAC.1